MLPIQTKLLFSSRTNVKQINLSQIKSRRRVRTISGRHMAPIFRVQEYEKQETGWSTHGICMQYIPLKGQAFSKLHSIATQKPVLLKEH
jgi:hypothetical protein